VIERSETIGDISLNEPGRPRPCLGYLAQCGVAAAAGAETMGTVGERRLVVRLQQEADHLADELVRPGRQAERPRLPVLLRDIDPLDWLESVALVAQRIDDAPDLRLGHAIRGLSVDSGRHGPLVGVQTPVGHQIQARIEQLSIELVARQATPPAFTEDIQHCFGVLHYAYLPALKYPITWPPWPCRRLSRPPWWGVTPTTTAGPPSP
jgi:hypothetical protein